MTPGLVIDVANLLGAPGTHRRVKVEESVSGLVTSLAVIPEDTPVVADLLLESVVEGILATGDLTGTMIVSCARCLTGFDAAFDFRVREMFAPGAGDDEEDRYPLRDEQIDLEPMFRDAIVLNMPFAPLCKEDCLGLCERCGGDRNLGECTCTEATDERWAGLAGIDFGPAVAEDVSRANGETFAEGRSH